jgi:P2-related tail formation protein
LALRLLLLCLVSLVVMPHHAIAQDPTAAETAATAWLAHVDAARYGDSWTSAGSTFKQAVTLEQWQEAVKRVRDQVGPLKTRVKANAAPMTNPPGAPAGEYVIFRYSSAFEQRPTATETVTAVREADGTWRIVGYFVQ